jgi:chemotaxis-related protein WspD
LAVGGARASERDELELGTHFVPIHDCWKLIGVEGDRTCRELLKFTHCRNCPVYSAAAIQLLDRPLPADYRRAGARHYAQQKKTGQATRLSAVLFRLANEWLALPTSVFQEVAALRTTHSLPHRHGGLLLGLVNERGELLICVSAARLLGIPSTEFPVPGSPVPNNPELERGTRNAARRAACW